MQTHVSVCALVCAFLRRISKDDNDFKVKETRFKPLLDVSASFDIKCCRKGLIIASFDIHKSLMIHIYQKLQYCYSFLLFSSLLITGAVQL